MLRKCPSSTQASNAWDCGSSYMASLRSPSCCCSGGGCNMPSSVRMSSIEMNPSPYSLLCAIVSFSLPVFSLMKFLRHFVISKPPVYRDCPQEWIHALLSTMGQGAVNVDILSASPASVPFCVLFFFVLFCVLCSDLERHTFKTRQMDPQFRWHRSVYSERNRVYDWPIPTCKHDVCPCGR